MAKRIIFHAWDARQAKKDGKKMTLTDYIIMLRSSYTHIELQFIDRNGVSFSSTMADDADGCRFKYIEYSNPKRWKSIELVVSDDVEADMWRMACEMADVPLDWQSRDSDVNQTIFMGNNHIQYDKTGLLSFALEQSKQWYVNLIRGLVWGWSNCIQPSDNKVWCSEACLQVWNAGQVSPKMLVHPTEIDPQQAIEDLERIKK